MAVADGGEAAPAVPPAAARVDATIEMAYAEHYAALSRYAGWLVQDPHLAADLVQEAFVRLAARWIRIREPRSYLFTIVTNLARAEWRRMQRERALVTDVDGVEDDLAAAIAIRTAVCRLPRKEREVVWLHYYADLPLTDIARITGRAEGTVKSQLYDARRRLARTLEEDRDERA